MATQGTQLYNYGDPKDGSNKQPIYPITNGDVVSVNVPNVTKKNAQDCISDLYNKIAELTKDEETVNNIKIEVKYFNSEIYTETEIRQIDPEKWFTSFVTPDSEKPYAWKKTKIFVEGMIFEDSQNFFRVDFGFSLCYNAPNDKGNVLGIYIGMDNF